MASNKRRGRAARWRFYSSTAKRLVQEQDICVTNYIFIIFFCITESFMANLKSCQGKKRPLRRTNLKAFLDALASLETTQVGESVSDSFSKVTMLAHLRGFELVRWNLRRRNQRLLLRPNQRLKLSGHSDVTLWSQSSGSGYRRFGIIGKGASPDYLIQLFLPTSQNKSK